jgi:hypothetical protein
MCRLMWKPIAHANHFYCNGRCYALSLPTNTLLAELLSSTLLILKSTTAHDPKLAPSTFYPNNPPP